MKQYIHIYIYLLNQYIHIYIYHHNYMGYIPMFLPIPICLTEPLNAKSWNLDLSWQNQCSLKPGLMIAFVDQTWSAAISHMKVMMLSCFPTFPTAKKCVPASRGRWPKGNRQAIDSFQMLLGKTWWLHDYLILHVLLYIYVHVYIHTCMYVCMYVYIYIYIYTHDFWLYYALGDKMPHHQKENSNPISLLLPPWKKLHSLHSLNWHGYPQESTQKPVVLWWFCHQKSRRNHRGQLSVCLFCWFQTSNRRARGYNQHHYGEYSH